MDEISIHQPPQMRGSSTKTSASAPSLLSLTVVDERQSPSRPIWERVRADLMARIQVLRPGDSLPTYEELAGQMKCSIVPVKRAMEELGRQGWVSLRRGRPARVLWTGSFSGSVRGSGLDIRTRVFLADFRSLTSFERSIERELGLTPGEPCIVCGRVRLVSGQAVAMQRTYVHPCVFPNPSCFFVDHDMTTASLRVIYAGLGVRALRVPAVLKVALADEQERAILSLPAGAPVLRSHQVTTVEFAGRLVTLEVMDASYTQEINYAVDRIPQWDVIGAIKDSHADG